MSDFFESDSFLLPSQVSRDVAGKLKRVRGIKSLELHLKGDAMEGAKKFSDMLLSLKRRGARISHEVSIKLEFPKEISREKALALVESMPKPRNGSLRVRVQVRSAAVAPAAPKNTEA